MTANLCPMLIYCKGLYGMFAKWRNNVPNFISSYMIIILTAHWGSCNTTAEDQWWKQRNEGINWVLFSICTITWFFQKLQSEKRNSYSQINPSFTQVHSSLQATNVLIFQITYLEYFPLINLEFSLFCQYFTV